MREGLFIRKNRLRWEKVLVPEQTADELAGNFVRILDDLSYARTFFPAGRVTQYINFLAAKVYFTIYRNRKEDSSRLFTFWSREVPLTMARHFRIVFLALVIFLLFFLVGFISSAKDPGFVRGVLGSGYVDMTERNIDQGNPFGVYANGNAFFMWMSIMVNNILVSFVYFFKGLALGVPSLTALGKESIRLGAFEHMFYAKGLGSKALLAVLIHGILELTAIIIACAAGTVMGTSILFPGTKKRMDAFRSGVVDGLKLLIGLIPIFMLAAFFESFITRYYKMPLPLNLALLTVTGSFIVWYFIIYPIRLALKKTTAL